MPTANGSETTEFSAPPFRAIRRVCTVVSRGPTSRDLRCSMITARKSRQRLSRQEPWTCASQSPIPPSAPASSPPRLSAHRSTTTHRFHAAPTATFRHGPLTRPQVVERRLRRVDPSIASLLDGKRRGFEMVAKARQPGRGVVHAARVEPDDVKILRRRSASAGARFVREARACLGGLLVGVGTSGEQRAGIVAGLEDLPYSGCTRPA